MFHRICVRALLVFCFWPALTYATSADVPVGFTAPPQGEQQGEEDSTAAAERWEMFHPQG